MEMEFAKVSVEIRTQVGKGGAHKVRAAGKVPGVLYGRKIAPVSVTFDEKALLTSLDKEKRRNTVFTLAVAGGEDVTAMVRDAQIHPISRRIVHVDFLRVDLNAEVHVEVPLVLTGKAIGTTNGGQLHQSMHVLPIAALPGAIPTKIEVDVTALGMGDALHVSDLKLAAGLRALLDPRDSVASVVAPKAEKVEEVAAAPVEGAVPAEGAAAAGGKPGDKAAGDKAAAPAAAGAKKEGGGEKKK
jgi:large subunit ribosomal protein L25